uniref:DUF4198 domain-containing protein n=1 Tax=Candidatus Electronema sp. TaxID=2698783 RepID=UPI0040576561
MMKTAAKHIGGLFLGLGCLLLATAAHAHEDWITASDYFPSMGKEVQLFLGNGHRFPNSDSAPEPDFITGVEVTSPGGRQEKHPVRLDAASNHLVASFSVKEAGTYLVSYSVPRPQDNEFMLLGRLAVLSGPDSGQYITEKGLEIAPLGKLSELRSGGTLPFALLLNGERIAGTLKITPEGGRTYTMSSSADRPAEISLDTSGKYLVATSRRGQYTNFSFFVQ